jgi:hypothetical protein
MSLLHLSLRTPHWLDSFPLFNQRGGQGEFALPSPFAGERARVRAGRNGRERTRMRTRNLVSVILSTFAPLSVNSVKNLVEGIIL